MQSLKGPVQKGSFLPRIEYKYYISPHIKANLIGDIMTFAGPDRYSSTGEGAYSLSSVYLDNYQLFSYRSKMAGTTYRQKVRFRFYLPLSRYKYINLEIKRKAADKMIKYTTTVDYDLFQDMIGDNPETLHVDNPDPVIAHFAALRKIDHFQPFLRIDYKRRAFFSRSDPSVRITIDYNIFCSRFMGDIDIAPNIPVFPSGVSILEIKTPDYFPFWLTSIIKKYSLKRAAISKYTIAVQNLAINSSLFIK